MRKSHKSKASASANKQMGVALYTSGVRKLANFILAQNDISLEDEELWRQAAIYLKDSHEGNFTYAWLKNQWAKLGDQHLEQMFGITLTLKPAKSYDVDPQKKVEVMSKRLQELQQAIRLKETQSAVEKSSCILPEVYEIKMSRVLPTRFEKVGNEWIAVESSVGTLDRVPAGLLRRPKQIFDGHSFYLVQVPDGRSLVDDVNAYFYEYFIKLFGGAVVSELDAACKMDAIFIACNDDDTNIKIVEQTGKHLCDPGILEECIDKETMPNPELRSRYIWKEAKGVANVNFFRSGKDSCSPESLHQPVVETLEMGEQRSAVCSVSTLTDNSTSLSLSPSKCGSNQPSGVIIVDDSAENEARNPYGEPTAVPCCSASIVVRNQAALLSSSPPVCSSQPTDTSLSDSCDDDIEDAKKTGGNRRPTKKIKLSNAQQQDMLVQLAKEAINFSKKSPLCEHLAQRLATTRSTVLCKLLRMEKDEHKTDLVYADLIRGGHVSEEEYANLKRLFKIPS